jgi:hypothetical protein
MSKHPVNADCRDGHGLTTYNELKAFVEYQRSIYKHSVGGIFGAMLSQLKGVGNLRAKIVRDKFQVPAKLFSVLGNAKNAGTHEMVLAHKASKKKEPSNPHLVKGLGPAAAMNIGKTFTLGGGKIPWLPTDIVEPFDGSDGDFNMFNNLPTPANAAAAVAVAAGRAVIRAPVGAAVAAVQQPAYRAPVAAAAVQKPAYRAPASLSPVKKPAFHRAASFLPPATSSYTSRACDAALAASGGGTAGANNYDSSPSSRNSSQNSNNDMFKNNFSPRSINSSQSNSNSNYQQSSRLTQTDAITFLDSDDEE